MDRKCQNITRQLNKLFENLFDVDDSNDEEHEIDNNIFKKKNNRLYEKNEIVNIINQKNIFLEIEKYH